MAIGSLVRASQSRSNGRWDWSLVVVLTLLLGACGGGGGGGSTPPVAPPPPATNATPVAAFSGAASVVAGVPLALDASASTDADSDPLIYSWNFGNGQNGGGQKIAPVFDAAGTFNVRLTVDDGRGGSHFIQKSVTVTAGPGATGNVNTLAIVRDSSGALLTGVTATVTSAGGATGTTGSDGRVTLATDRGVPITIKFSKAGYSDQFKTLGLPSVAESGYLTVTMLTRESPQTLASAAAGGALTGKDGAKVTFAPNSLVDANGVAVSGPVQVAMTPVNVATNTRAFPGRFDGVRTTGEQGVIVSYGTVEYSLSANGAPVQLAPGKKATIEIPIYIRQNLDGSPVVAGNTFPLWSLNEKTGGWTEEGVGTVVAGASPSDFVLRGEVTHFTWWNHDQFNNPPGRPKPKCLVDTNDDGHLEDLTGTGYCFHEAVINPVQSTGSSVVWSPEEKRSADKADAVTQRVPAFAATASTPTTGGVILPIPADVDVVFRSYAKNGSLFGSKLVRLGPGVEQDMEILLQPVQDAPASTTITLPYTNVFAVTVPGEIDRFVFAAQAGVTYDVRITRPQSSLLTGSARVVTASGSQLASGSFGADPLVGVVTPTAAGNLTIEVTAGGNAPGSYQIEVRQLATTSCGTPATLAIPSTTSSVPVQANGVTCFNLSLAADDFIQVVNTQQTAAAGSVSLVAPNGEQIIVDPYGGTGGLMQLFVVVAQPGTYRLQITNTAATNGTITGLGVSKGTLDGTLNVPGSVTYTAPNNALSSRFYVVKPTTPGSEFALAMSANGINQGFRVHPGTPLVSVTDVTARVLTKSVLVHPLVQVTRGNGSTAWNFNLSTSVPLSLSLNTDTVISSPIADGLRIYRFNAAVGQEVSVGVESDANLSLAPSVAVPTGQVPLLPIAQVPIYTLQEDGIQTALVRENSQNPGNFTIRLNTPAPFETVTLAPLTELDTTFVLGDVKRYSFNVTQGQVISLQLSSNTELIAGGTITGTAVTGGAALTQNSGSPPRVGTSDALYVQSNGTASLYISSGSRATGSTTGAVTARLYAPTPVPIALGAPIATTLQQGVLQTYGFNIPTAGRYLYCYRNGNPELNQFTFIDAKIWGPHPNPTNGDLYASQGAWSDEIIAPLRVGANTLSLLNRAADAPFNARLVALAAQPTALILGAAASNGSLTACNRSYFSFAGTAAQAYTVRVNAAFAGSVRVRKLALSGDPTQRLGGGNFEDNVGGTPLSLEPTVERVVSFTIPNNVTFGTGTYIIEVDGTDDATGTFTVSVASP